MTTARDSHANELRRALLAAALPALLLVGLGSAAAQIRTGDPTDALRDPTAVLSSDPTIGVVSNVGVVAWVVSVTACLMAAVILRRRGRAAAEQGFLLSAGLLTVVLLIDDLFLVHDLLLPVVLGVPEILTFGIYLAIAVIHFGRHWRTMLGTPWSVLALALVAFGLSLGLDVALAETEALVPRVAEDASKYVGIALWTWFHVRVALSALTSDGARSRAAPDPSERPDDAGRQPDRAAMPSDGTSPAPASEGRERGLAGKRG